MSAVLRISAIVHDLDLQKNILENDDAPAFTVINGGASSLRPHNLTGPECVEAMEHVPREPSFRQISDSVDPTAPARDGTDGFISNGERSRSNEAGNLRRASGNLAMLAGPFFKTPFVERKPNFEPCQRSVPAREASCLGHRVNVDIQDHERNQRHEPGTLNVPYTDGPFVTTDAPSARKENASDDPRVDPHCDQIRARKTRHFSNRTKTGCGTCRRRKKKCDEAKPKCKNCLQGNFECAGYTKPTLWSKNNNAQAPAPLGLHRRMSPAAAPAYIVPCPTCTVIHTPWCKPSQKSYSEPTVPSGIVTSGDRSARTDEQGRQISIGSLWYDTYVKPQQHTHRPLVPPQSRSPAGECHTQQSASQIAPCFPTAASQLPKYAQLENPASSDEAWLGDHRSNRSQPPPSPALAAQPAPSSSHRTQASPSRISEKDKMLSGQLFSPNTAQLVDERDLSSQASFRFNTAVQRASDERMWLFRQLVTAGWIYPRAGERHVTGHLGYDVNVSAPFHCDYGYNLSIGDNVILGPGCQLLDSGRIVIGKNTKIGARVTISTLDEPTVSGSLEESERTETAREVCIGKNVYVGDACIIKAGVRIGDT